MSIEYYVGRTTCYILLCKLKIDPKMWVIRNLVGLYDSSRIDDYDLKQINSNVSSYFIESAYHSSINGLRLYNKYYSDVLKQ